MSDRNDKGQFLKGRVNPPEYKEKLIDSLKGNNFGTILKEPDVRQDAFEDFCKHIAEGYPIKAWSFRKEPYRCSWTTMLRYIKENPSEFDSFLKEEAHSASYKKWFHRGIRLSDGEVRGNPSPQTWATIMRNMFHWDKEDPEEKQSASEPLKVIIADMDNANGRNHVQPETDRKLSTGESED